MGISLSVTTRGIPQAMARMIIKQHALLDALRDATEEGALLTRDVIRSLTPIMVINRGGSQREPGELMASEQYDVVDYGDGRLRGRVYTETDWAPFVEWGTREHGRARHMFGRGNYAARPLVRALFEARIAEVKAL